MKKPGALTVSPFATFFHELLNIRFMTIQLLRYRFYDWPTTTRKLDDLARVLSPVCGLLKGPE